MTKSKNRKIKRVLPRKRVSGRIRKISLKPKRKKNSVKKNLPRYTLNHQFQYFDELKGLILKSSPEELGRLASRIVGLGRVRLAIISGIFLNDASTPDKYETPADLFIVGDDINKKKLRSFLASLEAEVGMEIKFTLMDKDEFEYRFGMFDRFVRVLLEGPHEKIINKIGL